MTKLAWTGPGTPNPHNPSAAAPQIRVAEATLGCCAAVGLMLGAAADLATGASRDGGELPSLNGREIV